MADISKALVDPAVYSSLCFVFGLAVGSFLNVAIHRLPKMMERDWQAQCAELRGEALPPAEKFNLVAPRSRCPACGHRIGAVENIPLVSWAVLGGRCSACKTPISLRYPVVELLAGVAAAWCAARLGFGLAAGAAMVFLWCIITVSFIDFDTQVLPDSITLPLLWLGLLVNIPGTFTDLKSAVIGAAAGYLCLWSVYWLFNLATGKEGMGFGDFKLNAAVGAFLGWNMLPLVILISSVVGSIFGIGQMFAAKRGWEWYFKFHFGPYLAIAGVIALFWGPQITRYYLTQFA